MNIFTIFQRLQPQHQQQQQQQQMMMMQQGNIRPQINQNQQVIGQQQQQQQLNQQVLGQQVIGQQQGLGQSMPDDYLDLL